MVWSPNLIVTDLKLTAPGLGQEVHCTATLTVSDGKKSSSCTRAIDVSACSTGCSYYDRCGVCEGDGTSCLDCFGVPFGSAQYDRCGVCGGNGQSCINCESVDITDDQFALDTIANELLALARKLSRKIRRAGDRRLARLVRSSALGYQKAAWAATYDIPSNFLQCEQSPFCTEKSNASTLALVQKNIGDLVNLIEDASLQLRSLNSSRPNAGRKIVRSAQGLGVNASLQIQNIPPAQSICE